MGFLKNGQWVDQWYNTKKTDGRFVRQDPQFRNWITSDGKEGFKATLFVICCQNYKRLEGIRLNNTAYTAYPYEKELVL